jgi:hypothetical protein
MPAPERRQQAERERRPLGAALARLMEKGGGHFVPSAVTSYRRLLSVAVWTRPVQLSPHPARFSGGVCSRFR